MTDDPDNALYLLDDSIQGLKLPYLSRATHVRVTVVEEGVVPPISREFSLTPEELIDGVALRAFAYRLRLALLRLKAGR